MVKSTCLEYATTVQEATTSLVACPITPNIQADFAAPSGPPPALAPISYASTSHVVLSSDDDECALSNIPHQLRRRPHRRRHAHLLPRPIPHQIFISSDSEEAEVEPLIQQDTRAHIVGTKSEIEAITLGLASMTLTLDKEVQTDISIPPCLLAPLDIVKLQPSSKETPPQCMSIAASVALADTGIGLDTLEEEARIPVGVANYHKCGEAR